MKRILLSLLVAVSLSISCQAVTLTGGVEFRVRSNLTDLGTMGGTSDKIDYLWAVEASGPTQVYHAERTVGTSAADVLGMVGSLTNSIGSTVTFETICQTMCQVMSNHLSLYIFICQTICQVMSNHLSFYSPDADLGTMGGTSDKIDEKPDMRFT